METFDYHLFFSTLTYSDTFLPLYPISTEEQIPYADFHDVDLLVKRIRNDNAFTRPFKYLAVSERGGKKHRPHFHIMWMIKKFPSDKFTDCLNLEKIAFDAVLSRWSRNFSTIKRKPEYIPLTNYQNRFYAGKQHTNYDTHYVNPSLSTNGVSDAAFYVLKYMLKPSPFERFLYASLKSTLPPDEFYKTIKIVRSHCTMSKGIGNADSPAVVNYIRSCIERSDKSLGYPQYFSPDSGQRFPLCRYYRNKFLTLLQAYDFAFSNIEDYKIENSFQKTLQFKKFEKQLQQINEHETQVFYDLL